MINDYITNQCFGCSACSNICPTSSIRMEFKKGFLYPIVDKTTCIKCKMCLQTCPAINRYEKVPHLFKCFAARINDEFTIFKSTSGGIFSALSDFILKQKGYVCGAVYSPDYKSVFHMVSDKTDDRNKMRKSKYVQSDLKNCYKEISLLLMNGKTVLFTGTSCQVHALKLFLKVKKISTDNLILLDIVCHGAPSPIVYKNYIDAIENKYGKILNFNFRDKQYGWHSGAKTYIELENKRRIPEKIKNSYANNYFKNIITRPSCFSCPYTTIFRVGDLSIGDCWGIEKTKSKMNDERGVSLLLVNNRKGELILNAIRSKINLEEHLIYEFYQPNLHSPTSKPINYDRDFLKILTKCSLR